ncbi:hypothetical protein BCR36DRAFT_318179, partial [Piromyces finnis]
MKYLNILSLFAAGSAFASSCHPNYECCNNCQVIETDDEGRWGSLNGEWCFIDESKCGDLLNNCKFEQYGYKCCSHCDVYLTDEMGQWGVENNYWCGIPESCNVSGPTNNAPTENFFDNELYISPRYVEEIESSMPDMSDELKAKAKNVMNVSSAVWLAWEGAPDEVEGHLKAAGSKTITFILYMIPTRDCNSLASAGGASDLKKYQGIVDKIANTISKYPDVKVAMVIEPDTLGNLITGSTEACKNVHTLHKNALSYAANVFGNMSNVSAYLDAAHGKWLGWAADKTAAVIKEILDNAPNANIRGFSTNVSNYQSIEKEYAYHEALNAELEKLGITGKKFIVDTGRSGVDVTEEFDVNQTWCNFVYAGLGEPSRGSPDLEKMPLLDAYMWLKPPGEADGSDVGSRADPVCGREDSFPGSPDAGSWFSEYFISMLEKSPFYGETSTTPSEPTETVTPSEPTGTSSAPTVNFFDNELYISPRYVEDSFPGSPDAGSWFSEYFISMLEKSPFYGETSTTPSEPTETVTPSEPTGTSSAPTVNFFDNELYVNPRYAQEIKSSMQDMSKKLQAKANNVMNVSSAVWLAWEGAPNEVEGHLKAAGSKTITFILYMIPTRD